jgi:hypothetical protein
MHRLQENGSKEFRNCKKVVTSDKILARRNGFEQSQIFLRYTGIVWVKQNLLVELFVAEKKDQRRSRPVKDKRKSQMLMISRSLQSNLQTSSPSLFSVCCHLFPQSVVSISFLNVQSPSLDFWLLG